MHATEYLLHINYKRNKTEFLILKNVANNRKYEILCEIKNCIITIICLILAKY